MADHAFRGRDVRAQGLSAGFTGRRETIRELADVPLASDVVIERPNQLRPWRVWCRTLVAVTATVSFSAAVVWWPALIPAAWLTRLQWRIATYARSKAADGFRLRCLATLSQFVAVQAPGVWIAGLVVRGIAQTLSSEAWILLVIVAAVALLGLLGAVLWSALMVAAWIHVAAQPRSRLFAEPVGFVRSELGGRPGRRPSWIVQVDRNSDLMLEVVAVVVGYPLMLLIAQAFR